MPVSFPLRSQMPPGARRQPARSPRAACITVPAGLDPHAAEASYLDPPPPRGAQHEQIRPALAGKLLLRLVTGPHDNGGVTAHNFPALVVREQDGAPQAALETLSAADLPPGDVLIRVRYSSLNYKDGLAVTGKGKVIRQFPMVPGIDLAGTVEQSESPDWQPGEAVLVTGWGVGEAHWGGYAGFARMKSTWLTRLPAGLSLEHSMTIGTAGFTAMLAVMALEEHGVQPGGKPVLVTGAGGGVGSVAVALLAGRGYTVAASTGRADLEPYLKSLGASRIVPRDALARPSKPMESETWAGAIDSVGGQTLATLYSQIERHGAAAVCGLAGGHQLQTTVFPLILRGVSLLGIDSVYCPPARRQAAWSRLAAELSPARLDAMTTQISLADVPRWAETILAGAVRGRVVVTLGA